ncbi:MAG: septation protein A [Burkholderiaceae bacterium]
MKLLFDLFPVILFFVAYKLSDLYVATGVAIAASIVQILWLKMRGRPVEGMQWASLAIIVVFGGMTLLWHDETFIKWKPTVLYGLFAATLAVGHAFGRNFIKTVMSKQMSLPEPIWNRLNWAWALFFAAMAALNLLVAYRFATDVWVNFKLFGTLGLTLAFVVAQAFYVGRYVQEEN